MKKRRSAEEVARLLRDADRDLTKGLTVSDVCRKIGVAQTTSYRWRQRHDPAPTPDDSSRRRRLLETEVDRLKRLVAELMLDNQMLKDVAQKSGDSRSAASCRRSSSRQIPRLPTTCHSSFGSSPIHVAIPAKTTPGRAGVWFGVILDMVIGESTPCWRVAAGRRT